MLVKLAGAHLFEDCVCVREDKKGGMYAVHHHFILNFVSENQSQDIESLHADGAAVIHYSLTSSI